MPNPVIWVLADDITGHTNQSLGVAQQLQLPFEVKKIQFNKTASKPNWLKFNALKMLQNPEIFTQENSYPDICIAAGRKMAPLLRYLKCKNPNTFTVQLMNPKWPHTGLDIIAIPRHDAIPKISNSPILHNNRIVRHIGALHAITKEKLADYGSTKANMKSPVITILVGGDSKKTRFTLEMAQNMMGNIPKSATCLISTSRRTSFEVAEYLKTQATHFYSPKVPKAKAENPYMEWLACADYIVVTGDSISMVSEALAADKPFFIVDDHVISPKHQRFIHEIYARKYAMPFCHKINTGAQMQQPSKNSHENPTKILAERVLLDYKKC